MKFTTSKFSIMFIRKVTFTLAMKVRRIKETNKIRENATMMTNITYKGSLKGNVPLISFIASFSIY